MNTEDFITICKEEIKKFYNEDLLDKSDDISMEIDNIFTVWNCKTLQNNKALLSTTFFDGMYFEMTYNGDKQELYMDAYKKWKNKKIELKPGREMEGDL